VGADRVAISKDPADYRYVPPRKGGPKPLPPDPRLARYRRLVVAAMAPLILLAAVTYNWLLLAVAAFIMNAGNFAISMLQAHRRPSSPERSELQRGADGRY
jgi:hypothetical protein